MPKSSNRRNFATPNGSAILNPAVYPLAKEFSTFFIENKIFSPSQCFAWPKRNTSPICCWPCRTASQAGDKRRSRQRIRKVRRRIPIARHPRARFRETIDAIGAIFKKDLPQSEFSAIRLLYPLFCAIYHMKWGLPKLKTARKTIKVADYPKLKSALESIDALIEKIKEAEGPSTRKSLCRRMTASFTTP